MTELLSAAPTERPELPARRGLFAAVGGTVLGAASLLTEDDAEAASSTSAVLHLLRRTTFGPTPALVAQVKKQGAAAWLHAQLHPTSIPDARMKEISRRWPRLAMTPDQARKHVPHLGSSEVMLDLLASHVSHAIWSERQLFEVMVEFWTNHLVVPVPASEVWNTAHRYQADVIRHYALGRYVDLLWASAKHPALLSILGNGASTKKAPNENYGRELLELHTVGLGHYTERDVRNSALVLTGLTFDAEHGTYHYDAARHHRGRVKVMGWSSANTTARGGEKVARSYLAYLARHPSTARRLARKLAVRFVSDHPSGELVDQLAKVYLKHDTAIVPVLTALFASKEFRGSVGKKLKTPYEDAISTARVLGIKPEKHGDAGTRAMHWFLARMGQAPMNWPAPNGYPDVAAAWSGAGTTLSRWNMHLGLASGWWMKELQYPDLRSLLPAHLPKTYDGYVGDLARRLEIHDLSRKQRAAVCTFLDRRPGDRLHAGDAALSWRLPHVVALLLDTPNFAAR